MADRIYFAEVPSFIRSDGAIDTKAVDFCVNRLISAGYRRIAVAGMWGEYHNLSAADRRTLIKCAVDAASGRACIAAGAFEAGTEKAVEVVRENRALGAAYNLCIPSHYFSMAHTDEITRHFDVLTACDAGIIVVNNPAFTGFSIPEDLQEKLASKAPGLIDCSADAARPGRQTRFENIAVSEEFALIGMNAPYISRFAALFPNIMLHIERISDEARRALLELCRFGIAGLKHSAYALGLCGCDDLLPPYLPIDAASVKAVEALIDTIRKEEARYDG